MGYYTLEFLYGRFEYLALAVLIVGLASILLVLKKYRLAGAICFLAPMPLYVYINFLSLRYSFVSIAAIGLALVSIAPFVVFAIFMLKKMKNILFIIPSALIFVSYIFMDVFDLYLMNALGGFGGIYIYISGFQLGDILIGLGVFIPLLIACLLGRKVKFLAYLPFAIYTTATLLVMAMFIIGSVFYGRIASMVDITLPFLLVFSMALFCMAKQLASEKVPEKVQVEQIPAPQPVYTQPVYAQPAPYFNNGFNNAGNVANELSAYKHMYETGLITEEEFNQKKKQILGI